MEAIKKSMRPKYQESEVKVYIQIEGPEDRRKEVSEKMRMALHRMKCQNVGYMVEEVKKIKH